MSVGPEQLSDFSNLAGNRPLEKQGLDALQDMFAEQNLPLAPAPSLEGPVAPIAVPEGDRSRLLVDDVLMPDDPAYLLPMTPAPGPSSKEQRPVASASETATPTSATSPEVGRGKTYDPATIPHNGDLTSVVLKPAPAASKPRPAPVTPVPAAKGPAAIPGQKAPATPAPHPVSTPVTAPEAPAAPPVRRRSQFAGVPAPVRPGTPSQPAPEGRKPAPSMTTPALARIPQPAPAPQPNPIPGRRRASQPQQPRRNANTPAAPVYYPSSTEDALHNIQAIDSFENRGEDPNKALERYMEIAERELAQARTEFASLVAQRHDRGIVRGEADDKGLRLARDRYETAYNAAGVIAAKILEPEIAADPRPRDQIQKELAVIGLLGVPTPDGKYQKGEAFKLNDDVRDLRLLRSKTHKVVTHKAADGGEVSELVQRQGTIAEAKDTLYRVWSTKVNSKWGRRAQKAAIGLTGAAVGFATGGAGIAGLALAPAISGGVKAAMSVGTQMLTRRANHAQAGEVAQAKEAEFDAKRAEEASMPGNIPYYTLRDITNEFAGEAKDSSKRARREAVIGLGSAVLSVVGGEFLRHILAGGHDQVPHSSADTSAAQPHPAVPSASHASTLPSSSHGTTGAATPSHGAPSTVHHSSAPTSTPSHAPTSALPHTPSHTAPSHAASQAPTTSHSGSMAPHPQPSAPGAHQLAPAPQPVEATHGIPLNNHEFVAQGYENALGQQAGFTEMVREAGLAQRDGLLTKVVDPSNPNNFYYRLTQKGANAIGARAGSTKTVDVGNVLARYMSGSVKAKFGLAA